MNNILTYISTKAAQVAELVNLLIENSFTLAKSLITESFNVAERFSNTAIRIFLCVILYKVAFEGLLNGIF